MFLEKGGTLKDAEPVLNVTPGPTTRVRTSKGEYKCDRLIIAAGAWTPKLIHPLGVNIPLQVNLHKSLSPFLPFYCLVSDVNFLRTSVVHEIVDPNFSQRE